MLAGLHEFYALCTRTRLLDPGFFAHRAREPEVCLLGSLLTSCLKLADCWLRVPSPVAVTTCLPALPCPVLRAVGKRTRIPAFCLCNLVFCMLLALRAIPILGLRQFHSLERKSKPFLSVVQKEDYLRQANSPSSLLSAPRQSQSAGSPCHQVQKDHRSPIQSRQT